MNHRTKINTMISAAILLLYVSAGYVYAKGTSHSGIALFIVYGFGGIIFALLGMVACIYTIVSGKHWSTILFISSGLGNFMISCMVCPAINVHTPREDVWLAFLLLAPFLVFLWQVLLIRSYGIKHKE